jgi:hypothetical protein
MIYNILIYTMVLVTLSGCGQGSSLGPMPTIEFITHTWIWSLMAFITIASLIIRLIRDTLNMFRSIYFLIFGVILIVFGIWGYWEGGFITIGGKGPGHSYWFSWLWVFIGGFMIFVYTFMLPDRSNEKK